MAKLTREQFIGILESGKYTKITGHLQKGVNPNSCCAIGAVLTETKNMGEKAAPGFTYLPKQLVEDLDITPQLESRIFGLNDRTGNDNWKAVIEMLRKEWNIHGEISINVYEVEQLLDAYMTEYYAAIEIKEDFGYETIK